MNKTQIIWTPAEALTPAVDVPYVDVHGILADSLKLVSTTRDDIPPANLLFNSIHGLGKSLLCATLAIELGKALGTDVPMVTFDCSEDTREFHLKGSSQRLPDGSTAFVPGPFPQAIHLANEVGVSILCAEEISALTPGAQKMFNAMTDWRRSMYIAQLGTVIKLRPGAVVIVVSTMNPAAYGGVYTLNSDLRSRLNECIVPLPTMTQEKEILGKVCPSADKGTIEKAIQVALDSRNDVTDYTLSTRDLVHLLRNIHRLDKDLNRALTYVANKFEGSDREVMLDKIDATFATKLKSKLGRRAA
jgi:MoxR-like ATPase